MSDPTYLARTTRTAIRYNRRADEAEYLARVHESRELHDGWLSLPATPQAFGALIDRLEAPATEGFLVCETESDAVVGFVNVNNIVHGAFQCGAVGYGAFANGAGRGHMTEGLGLVIRYAFGPLGLHRLEANIQPGNKASLALARRAGFRQEGFSPDFLFIDGAWRDHERWAITAGMVQDG
ncbi:hypothetical protein SRB5_26770 [Streptomyces sp. RB5]|uniref:N-acetyltransferase domain-containing protein n=1 Tax=Streptomyces smaragdinus TaxID=2585196 RepID=A0A7K0CHS6_9ACTN|nr:GNAT family protein [Streptomyces smaragdinus]MQY12542.1 hypothetical protein [Streptomyces smaragdinus]